MLDGLEQEFNLQSDIERVVEVKAVLREIFWSNGRRIVGGAHPAAGGAGISIIGDMIEPAIGQLYNFTGKWKRNDRFNKWEMHFAAYQTVLPDDTGGIYYYLVQTAKWVGPETATALIDAFGTETLNVLKNPNSDIHVKGLTGERLCEIRESLIRNEATEKAIVELNSILGGVLSPSVIQRAITRWGSDAGRIIRRDPFRLTQLHGIGFLKADAVYLKAGGDKGALRRHAHAAMFAVQQAASEEGHTRLLSDQFYAGAGKLVEQLHPKTLPLCVRAKKLRKEDGFICDTSLYEAERFIADRIIYMMTDNQNTRGLRVPDLPAIQQLHEDQAAALRCVADNRICIITGAPGTGKTFTIARVIMLLQEHGLWPELAAPTGKAAKQMQLALQDIIGNRTARTIHSLLEAQMDDEGFSFGRDASNPLKCNAMVLDEVSMIDVRLLRSLFEALPQATRLVIVGDHYQLPSVGPGAVLRDMLGAGVPSYELSTIKRNAGRIVYACHAIKDGRIPEPAEKLNLETGDNWRHIEVPAIEQIKGVIEQLLAKKLPELGYDAKWQVQVISPTNERGGLACSVLNEIAKKVLNPINVEKHFPFAKSDKIVRLKNGFAELVKPDTCPENPKHQAMHTCSLCSSQEQKEAAATVTERGVRIVNGDIGEVIVITDKKIVVRFLYPIRTVLIPRMENHLRLAYCMTCHKMQGSEVEVVVLPIHRTMSHIPILTREWMYTAFSRAKKILITVGELSALAEPIRRIGNVRRQTNLKEMIQCFL
jgi:exodeoxyribonuclease V alpha subunit